MNKKIYKILNEIKNDNFRAEVETLILAEKDGHKILLKPFYLRHLVEILNMLKLNEFESGVIENLEFFIENNLKYVSKEDKFRTVRLSEFKNTSFLDYFPYKILIFKSKLNSNEGKDFYLLSKATIEEFEIITKFLSNKVLRGNLDYLTLGSYLKETRNIEQPLSLSMLIKILNITDGRILKENVRIVLKTINTAIEMNLYELFIRALKHQALCGIDAISFMNLIDLLGINFENEDNFKSLIKQINSLNDKDFEVFLEMLKRLFHNNIQDLIRTFKRIKLTELLNQYLRLKFIVPSKYHEEYAMNLLIRFTAKHGLFEDEKRFAELVILLRNISLTNVDYLIFEKVVYSMISFYEKALNSK